MRQFLDQLPRVIASKPDPMRERDDPRQQQVVARALEATLHLRQARFTYHSQSSDRTKTYLVHPYRLAYAQGGLYLLAYVPEYGEVRTFAIERMQDMSLLEERFTPIEELPDAAFPHSLGVHSGPPEHVEIEFEAVGRRLRARARMASSRSGCRGRARRRRAHDAGRLPRSRASELDPELRSASRGSSHPSGLANDIAKQIQKPSARPVSARPYPLGSRRRH